MWINVGRIIKSGFVSFWRNWFVSLASLLMMTVTLSVIGALIFLSATLATTLDFIRSKVDVSAYFVSSAAESDIMALKSSLESLPEVLSVEYISRDEALKRFRERHANDQLTLQALDELGDNPLEASLSIKAKDPSQYENIAKFLGGSDALGRGGTTLLDKVNYAQNKTAIDKLSKIIEAARTFGYALTGILVVASLLITFITIRLAIYISKEEIAVMRLVGASNAYIQGPFIFIGFIYGLIAALVTMGFLYGLTVWLGPVTARFFTGTDILEYYLNNFGELFLILLSSGMLLGVAASFWAVKRYLKEV